MLKKIITTAMSLACSLSFAGTMGPSCETGNVTVPCINRAWDLGVQAIYLKPIYSLDRAFESSNTSDRSLNNDWKWGYRLEGSYHFNTGNDINLNWTHYDVDNQFDGFPLFPAGPIFIPYSLELSTQFDQVNLVFGQQTDVGLMKNIHFYGGLQYVSIHSDINRNFHLTPLLMEALDITGLNLYDNADFSGLGPVLGIDYAYDFLNGFSLTASTEGSILSGSARQRTGRVFSPTGLVLGATYASRKSLVPGVEAKLGINYAYQLGHGTLNILGGYQVLNYFHALSLPALSRSGDSDFGLFGPYFGINWKGNL
jgi:hypothetical protein